MRMLRLCFAILLLVFHSDLAAQIPADGQYVYIYSDGHCDAALKNFQKAAKSVLKSRDIRWKLKGSKKASWTTLKDSVEKDLLKAKADYYILMLGLNDVWDAKKKSALDYDENAIKTAIETVISQLKSAGKQVLICTPHQIYEGNNESANQHLQNFHAIMTDFSEQAPICDFYQAFAKMTANNAHDKDKGLYTKDGIKLNDEGASIITRVFSKAVGISVKSKSKGKTYTLQKNDYVILGSSNGKRIPDAFNAASKEKYDKQWPFEIPRLSQFEVNAYSMKKVDGVVDQLLSQKATYYILSPGIRFDYEGNVQSLQSGQYAQQLIAIIKALKQKSKAPIILTTWPVWNEDTEANDLVIDGPNYKLSAEAAKAIHHVAEETSCPVIDIYQMSIDIIQEKGVEGMMFAGKRRKVKNNKTVMNGITDQGRELFAKEISKLFNIEF